MRGTSKKVLKAGRLTNHPTFELGPQMKTPSRGTSPGIAMSPKFSFSWQNREPEPSESTALTKLVFGPGA